MPGVVLADIDERILLGELGESRPQRTLLFGLAGEDDGLECRPGKRAVASSPGRGSPIASPTRTAPRPRIVAISPAVMTSRRGAPAGAKTRIEVALASPPPPTATRWRGRSVPANRRA